MQTPDAITALWPLLLGWFLGLLSPTIVDAIKKEREADEIRTTILQELREIRYQLALAVHLVISHQGSYSRSNFLWLDTQLQDFKNREGVEKAFAFINMALTLTDAQIAQLTTDKSEANETSPALKQYGTPVLDSKMSSFTCLDKDLQSKLMEIHIRLNLLNQIVDEYRIYFQLTFTTVMDSWKEDRVKGNINVSLNAFKQQAIKIVESIHKLESKMETG